MMTSLAKSRLKYNRSRTVLTCVAVILTTTLLMALGTSAMGLLDFNRQQAAANSNLHGRYDGINAEQVKMLSNHTQVESLEASQIFASVEHGKMNGMLTYKETIKDGIYYGTGQLIEGRAAEKSNEICGPSAFFERLGVKPQVGERLTLSFRVQGKGEILTRDFVISGLVSERDVSKLDVSDTRIMYGAEISEALLNEMLPQEQRSYNAAVRISGEDSSTYDEMCQSLEDIAEDIGCGETALKINKEYLGTATDPGTDVIRVVVAIALLIIVFSGVVIYSIYYVGVITDVQEIGKLKALGASKKQIKRLITREGMFVMAISIPIGLVLGFLIPYLILPVIMRKSMEMTYMTFDLEGVSMFSLPVTILVAVAVLITVYISMLKPLRMAGRISPVEAMRYQESRRGRKLRKGYKNINVFRLSKANLTRNRRRTVVTMVTMGLSCVLFMSLAGVLSSMRAEDIADRELEGSDFKIAMDYEMNDEEYPENNLESISENSPFTDELMEQLESIDGVEKIRRVSTVPISSDSDAEIFKDGNHVSLSFFDEEKGNEYRKELESGELDYDSMVAGNGAVFTSDVFSEEYGIGTGDRLELTIYDGYRQVPLTVTVTASLDTGNAAMLEIPKELYDSLGLQSNSTTDLYIDVNEESYDEVKEELQQITDSQQRFSLFSRDEEMEIGAMGISMTKYPMYAILLMIAVIGFMNLINTMITSIVTRQKELGVIQAIGLDARQLLKMLSGEGMVFVAGTLAASLTVGNLVGYLVYLWGKEAHFMSLTGYHYPMWETLLLAAVLILGQLVVTFIISRRLRRQSIIDRIRGTE